MAPSPANPNGMWPAERFVAFWKALMLSMQSRGSTPNALCMSPRRYTLISDLELHATFARSIEMRRPVKALQCHGMAHLLHALCFLLLLKSHC